MSIPAPYQQQQLPLPDPEAYPGEPREYARALMQRKDEIEKEIDELKDVLSSHGAGADTPLLDPEGYPRGDIDIYAIRHARSALVRLYNDRSEVVRLLAAALESAFESGSSSQAPATTATSSVSTNTAANGHSEPSTTDIPDSWPERPIARVNSIAPQSPAAEAGLRAGDVIYSFAGITALSGGGMAAIGPVVAGSEGRPLRLLILRNDERLALRLTPRSGWGGRGLLGCHILPV